MALVLLLLAALLTFGDEILLRLVDRLDIGGKGNSVAAQKLAIEEAAYYRYLRSYKTRALAQAETIGEHSPVTFDWLKEPNE
ncbi:hypothetical protein IQ265_23250 [Nodosilinea sp. LEGE 06152]|uniref:hypothetical protein n=1 Tax=Nodosilinea sp. LEGE 06152 TaxID=2777966 RepID=UPI00187FDC98|nr:hypothetical protein [Nodosilinea sp. LEGE 06152]MBE9159729.1 hypothetical protein [Nodosilinea sp. LEGE 06152]